ncbi:DUF2057 family protein [Thioalkalivibrio sp. XN279]|uniref:DUF2057 family protein n=1 Tax=Thioalkalivibrio sp. XN279 TaxID=2714953 RepID=UPI00140C4310|nr:DUF2057 family protein [Thioalkalivibrio sp. XN279]NHA14975.1 DUF2057 domain-containing protein [Thioalkalivibrio sp. XN279]
MSKPVYLPLLVLAAAALAGCATAPVTLHDPEVPQAAVAAIVLPEQLEVATVNGREIEGASGMLTRGDKTLELAPGRYELVVFYRELWEWGDHHEVLRSDPALFVVDAGAGGRYRIDYERPADVEAARKLAADFTGWVENQATGERIAARESGLQFRRGLVPALTFDDTLVPAAERSADGQLVPPLPTGDAPRTVTGAASLPVPAAVPAYPATPGVAPAVAPAPEGSWLDLMKSFWSEASSEERRAFLRWLAEQR